MKNMKKLLSTILTFVLVLSMTTVAFAADEQTTYTDMSTVTLSKTYKLTNAGTVSPEETFEFGNWVTEGEDVVFKNVLNCVSVTDAAATVTIANAPVPTIASVSYIAGEAGSATAKKDITITLPTYESVGVYTYTFVEKDGATAGVTYRDAEIKLVVTVIEQEGKVRVAAVHTEGSEEGTKSNAFDNIYSAGSLAVSKKVAGILGITDKDFTMTVTFTAPEGDTVESDISYTDDEVEKTIAPSAWTTGADGKVTATADITLTHGETVNFTNIPYGVTYEVVEADYSEEGYVVTYDSNKTGTINAASVSTVITNTKGGTVDTGIVMDSAPYIVLLAIVCVGFFGFVSKKRMMDEI